MKRVPRRSLGRKEAPVLSMAERRALAAQLTAYLAIIPPEERALPGFPGTPGKWERHGHGRPHTIRKTSGTEFVNL
jgi:hypothetical protein